MKKIISSRSFFMAVIILFSLFLPAEYAYADSTDILADDQENSGDNGETSENTFFNPDYYVLVIDDEADLLTDAEEEELRETYMAPIGEYGNVAFLSTDNNEETAEEYAKNFYETYWGTDSGTIFLIDMSNRKLWIQSDGLIYNTVSTGYANTITDNVYQMATDEDYFSCAKEAYSEIYALLSGSKISQPMKYITNALLAVIIAALLMFGYIYRFMIMKAPSDDEILEHLEWHCNIGEITAKKTGETRKYNPPSSSSDSSGGGGGSSGGGGGHSF